MKKGDTFNYGLWDGRQVPVKVSKLGKNKLASEFKVIKTIPFLCKEGAVIPVNEEFWEGFKE